MEKMLWCKDGLTWEIFAYAGDAWPTWTVSNDDGKKKKFFTSQNLFDCILWAESQTGKKISMLDVFAG